MLAANWGTGQVFLSFLWFFLFFMWIWLAIMVFADIFRSKDMGGWAKALWCIFIIVAPFLGVFVYLIARGKKMGEHAQQDAAQQDAAMKAYIRDAVATTPTASGAPAASSGDSQLAALTTLRDQGVIDNEEYQRMKARVTAV
ncbi:MAG TPA: SHOCT domain-containing protein [Acidimicrobiales bacterium]|nr:SHOCT domain-containing protein [Acidimicrobiales bacterium]